MLPSIPYIRVHDSVTVRESPNHSYDFSSNGIRVIQPISCTVTEEINGLYSCNLEHAIDENEDWTTLNENNIISVPIVYHERETKQLFRINEREVAMNDRGEKRIKITATHIFYDLIARVIEIAKMENVNCYNAISILFANIYKSINPDIDITKAWYPYAYSSDIQDIKTLEFENMSIPAALIGDDSSICETFGGQIYRDNFYFSINKQKEGSIHHPIPIKYGMNMISITETVDWSDYCNYVHAYDNFGNQNDVSYTEFYTALGDIVKIVQFNYAENNPDKLYEDMIAYFAKYSVPIVNYKINFYDISGSDLYKEFFGLQKYEVGDTVDVINERLGIETKSTIIRKVYDVLRRKTTEIELGTQKGSIVKRGFMSETAYTSPKDVQALQRTSVRSKNTRTIQNLTEEEYNNLQEKDPETLYVVFDEKETE